MRLHRATTRQRSAVTDEEILADLLYPGRRGPMRRRRGRRPARAERSPEDDADAGRSSWQDPLSVAAAGAEMAGIDYMRALAVRRASAAPDRRPDADAAGRGRARAAPSSRASPARSTTTRSASSTAATRRRCSTPRSAAPCTRRSRRRRLHDAQPRGEDGAADNRRDRARPRRGRGRSTAAAARRPRRRSSPTPPAASCSPTATATCMIIG